MCSEAERALGTVPAVVAVSAPQTSQSSRSNLLLPSASVCQRVFLPVPIPPQLSAAPACLHHTGLPLHTSAPPPTADSALLLVIWCYLVVQMGNLDFPGPIRTPRPWLWVFLNILAAPPHGSQILPCMVEWGQERHFCRSPEGPQSSTLYSQRIQVLRWVPAFYRFFLLTLAWKHWSLNPGVRSVSCPFL